MRLRIRSFFQTAEERFRDGVVPTLAPPAHAWLEVMSLTEATKVVAAVLTALVRAHDHPPVRFPAPHGREQCV